MTTLCSRQIQAQVSAIRRSLKNGARHFAIRTASDWAGARHMVIDGDEHLVLPCVSDLQLREALLQAEQEDKPSVLLCSMRCDAIGDDVLDRLAKRRVFPFDEVQIIGELFQVHVNPETEGKKPRIHQQIRKTKPLMRQLIALAPPEGYPPLPGGTLDLETAWLSLLGRVFGERIETPSLIQLLEWSLDEEKLRRLTEMDADLKEAFVDWFARTKGDSVRFMVAAIDSGFGGDLVPLGAALGLVFHPEHHQNAENHTARGRLERYLKHRKVDPECARAWSRATDMILAQWEGGIEGKRGRKLLNRFDDLIRDLGLTNNAWISDHSPMGLEQRYEQAAEALLRAISARSSSGLDAVRDRIALIRKHLLGEADPDRLTRLEMGCRLIRWLKTTETSASGQSLDAMVVDYHQEGGFIDGARNRLKETDEAPEVQKAYDAILKRVDERARSFERDFATQLQDWTRSESRSGRLTLIEDVLKEVVTPVAKQQPVLMLVLDGMSMAVFRQLLQDVLRHDWTEIAHEGLSLPRPVLATLPSVTSISRRALFLGRLDVGTKGTEEGEFKKNDLLYQKSGSQVRPQLFKMGDLAEDGQGGIASAVRRAIADKKCRVVSVVLNAIDDHLDSGKQIDFNWTRNTIRGLRDLLRQASDAERLVIMTSDHGHVLDFGTKQVPSVKEGRGDRFRVADGKTEEGELEFEGIRIDKATGTSRITLACSAKIRYGRDKRGYHGGANPQEMVVPLAILSDVRAKLQPGWKEISSHHPAWWPLDAAELVSPPVAAPKLEKAVEGLELFEQTAAKASAAPDWIADLLASAIYEEQSKLAVRGAPSPELMRKLLSGLHTRGGTAVKQALAQELAMPPFRLDGLIQNVSRILNVDGYEVISLNRTSDTVTLNSELLRTQFDLQEKS